MPYIAPGQEPVASIPKSALPAASEPSEDVPTTQPDDTQPPSSAPPSENPLSQLESLRISSSPSANDDDTSPIETEAEATSRRDSETTTSSLPGLDIHSVSSSSIASMDDVSTPATTGGLTSPTTPIERVEGEEDDGVTKYRKGLYAYTHGLYLEAKLSIANEEKRRNSVGSAMQPKQSGMERLAAKKALAKRLNAQ